MSLRCAKASTHAELPISGIAPDGNSAFEYFVDDDMGASVSFEDQFRFLHESYFPRIAWSKLTLSPAKSSFLMPRVNGLKFVGGPLGLRPSADKVKAIRAYPVPTNEAEIDKFLFMTTYIRKFIPGRAEYARIMKEAVVRIAESIPGSGCVNSPGGEGRRSGKRKLLMKAIGFEWKKEQQDAFDAIKHAIINNACWGGDPTYQYHLATDASASAYGGVLFQLPALPTGTKLEKGNKDEMRILQFVSKSFTDPETRYHTTEREGLAVIRCLDEVRWLVMQAMDIPVMVDTDHKALLSILDGSLAKDPPNAARSARIDRWQLRLAEYNLKFQHIPGVENKIADGLSRLPVSAMEVGVAGREEDLVEALMMERMDAGEKGMKMTVERKDKDKTSGEKEKEKVVGAGKRKDVGERAKVTEERKKPNKVTRGAADERGEGEKRLDVMVVGEAGGAKKEVYVRKKGVGDQGSGRKGEGVEGEKAVDGQRKGGEGSEGEKAVEGQGSGGKGEELKVDGV
jgi:hypothetical protein